MTRIEPNVSIFSGGEVQVTWPVGILRGSHLIQVVANLSNSDDIMALLISVDAIRRNTFHEPTIELIIPYFPYARQDRVCADGQSLSLAVMANLINGLNARSVTVCDPHSDATGALINNLRIVSQSQIVSSNKKICRQLCHRDTIIIAPDAGASKKAQSVARNCGKGTPVVQALKQRDAQTGAITETILLGSVAGKHCIIVDDICDGGRTFIELARALKENGATKVSLFVTHGIFSRGLSTFNGLIENIYTTNSFTQKVHEPIPGVTLDIQTLSLI
jgi:ribose-phosphate pyrophosphokinase